MSESSAMLEIREIRNRNSLRHLNMTPDEIAKEFDESVKRFSEHLGKEIKIISSPALQTQSIGTQLPS